VVQRLAAETGAELRQRRIETAQEAHAARFLGSPTVRVNGRDVDPGADERTDYGLNVAFTAPPGLGQSPIPPEQWIRAAPSAFQLCGLVSSQAVQAALWARRHNITP
jgi:hypothetical protein